MQQLLERGEADLTGRVNPGSAGPTASRVLRRRRALSQFLERVTRVNENPYFQARVTRVVLFGGMLRLEVDRLSDVDLAVELARKETDAERASQQNRPRAEELAEQGRRFRNFLEWEACWYLRKGGKETKRR